MRTSLPKRVSAMATLAEKTYGNIDDELLKEFGVGHFNFDVDDETQISVIIDGESISLSVLKGKGKQPKKTVQSFQDIDVEDFLELVAEPVVEVKDILPNEKTFVFRGHTFLLIESNIGYESRGRALSLFVLEGGFKRTYLKDMGWTNSDRNSGLSSSASLRTYDYISVEEGVSLALGYIFKYLKMTGK